MQPVQAHATSMLRNIRHFLLKLVTALGQLAEDSQFQAVPDDSLRSDNKTESVEPMFRR